MIKREVRSCLICNKSFEVRLTSDVKLCSSKSCIGKYRRNLIKPRQVTCVDCGSEIITTAPIKYRCDKCRLLNRRKQRREHYQRHRDTILIKSKENHARLMQSNEYRLKRKITASNSRFDGNDLLALERDNFACQLCNATNNLLVVHHKDGKSNRNGNKADNSLENLQTLCRKCHINIHMETLLASRA